MFIVLKKKIIIAVAACILTIIAIPVAIHYTNNAAEAGTGVNIGQHKLGT